MKGTQIEGGVLGRDCAWGSSVEFAHKLGESMPAPASPTARPIRVLPQLVANQIAAGEVVDRPASVVKELTENALDAGSTRITLELEQGGIELIRVTDDGGGIPEQELQLALAPHATSKIAETSDLDKIATLGFRGEALASIASVSRLSLRSRTAEMLGAAVVDVEGTTLGAPRPAPGPVGTCITVRNLFFNTPARRKFLKTVATEQERAVDAFKQIALAHPGVGFTATVDGRRVLDVAPAQSPRQRAVSILGKDLESQLLDIHADEFDDTRGVALWGLVGLPSIARGSNKHQYIFVNGRAIKDRTIQHAVTEAYRGLIEPSRYPTALLMLEMSAQGVDVNVHPQKAEVRFRDGSLIHSVVLRAVREALRRADLTPAYAAVASAMKQGAGQQGLPGSGYAMPGEGAYLAPGNENITPADGPGAIKRFVEYFRSAQSMGSGQRFDYDSVRAALSNSQGDSHSQSGEGMTAGLSEGTQPGLETPPGMRGRDSVPLGAGARPDLLDTRPKSRVLQVHNSYLVTQDESGVVIIDQHALHERIMFEYLVTRLIGTPGHEAGAMDAAARAANPESTANTPSLERQHLLAPAILPVTKAQLELLPALVPLLERIGIEAAQSGPGTVSIHAFPTFLFDRSVDPIEFVQELLERAEATPLMTDLRHGGEQALRTVLDMMSCKAAVKAGDRMSDIELTELVRLRGEVERSSNCPHGRPTSIRLTLRELEKLFGRG